MGWFAGMGSRPAVGSADPADADALSSESLDCIASAAFANSHANASKASANRLECCLASVTDGVELHFGGAKALADYLDVHEQSWLRGRSRVAGGSLPPMHIP